MIIKLIIGAALYAAFPILYAKFLKKPVTKKQYTTVCSIVAIVVYFFCNNMETDLWVRFGAIAAIVITTVACIFGIKTLTARGLLKTEGQAVQPTAAQEEEGFNTEETEEETAEAEAEKPAGDPFAPASKGTCSQCGAPLRGGESVCEYCGSKIE